MEVASSTPLEISSMLDFLIMLKEQYADPFAMAMFGQETDKFLPVAKGQDCLLIDTGLGSTRFLVIRTAPDLMVFVGSEQIVNDLFGDGSYMKYCEHYGKE